MRADSVAHLLALDVRILPKQAGTLYCPPVALHTRPAELQLLLGFANSTDQTDLPEAAHCSLQAAEQATVRYSSAVYRIPRTAVTRTGSHSIAGTDPAQRLADIRTLDEAVVAEPYSDSYCVVVAAGAEAVAAVQTEGKAKVAGKPCLSVEAVRSACLEEVSGQVEVEAVVHTRSHEQDTQGVEASSPLQTVQAVTWNIPVHYLPSHATSSDARAILVPGPASSVQVVVVLEPEVHAEEEGCTVHVRHSTHTAEVGVVAHNAWEVAVPEREAELRNGLVEAEAAGHGVADEAGEEVGVRGGHNTHHTAAVQEEHPTAGRTAHTYSHVVADVHGAALNEGAEAVEDGAHSPDDPTMTLAEAGAAVEHAEAEEAVDQGCTFSSRTAHVPVQQAHSMSVAVQTTEVEAEEAHQPLP